MHARGGEGVGGVQPDGPAPTTAMRKVTRHIRPQRPREVRTRRCGASHDRSPGTTTHRRRPLCRSPWPSGLRGRPGRLQPPVRTTSPRRSRGPELRGELVGEPGDAARGVDHRAQSLLLDARDGPGSAGWLSRCSTTATVPAASGRSSPGPSRPPRTRRRCCARGRSGTPSTRRRRPRGPAAHRRSRRARGRRRPGAGSRSRTGDPAHARLRQRRRRPVDAHRGASSGPKFGASMPICSRIAAVVAELPADDRVAAPSRRAVSAAARRTPRRGRRPRRRPRRACAGRGGRRREGLYPRTSMRPPPTTGHRSHLRAGPNLPPGGTPPEDAPAVRSRPAVHGADRRSAPRSDVPACGKRGLASPT